MKIYIDTLPLHTGHQIRGIGRYTQCLIDALREEKVEILTSPHDNWRQADLVHYPYFDLFKATLPINRSKKTVVTIHDVIPLEFPKAHHPGLRGCFNLLHQELSLWFAQAVITDSEYSKQQITELLRIRQEKMHVVPLAANPNISLGNASSIETISNKYQIPKKYILYVGDINYNKNLPELIKAVADLPADIKLICIGKNFREQSIPEWQAIKLAMSKNKLADRVHFISTIGLEDNADLAAIYHGALCYVQPSLSEGFGLPVLEAMQCQTPVVATKRGSLPEVGGSHAIYVEPLSDAIAEGVKEVLSWSNRSREQWLLDAAHWAAGFTWKKTAEDTIKVYKQVLS